MNDTDQISLYDFLVHNTYAQELCVIREDGWIVTVVWIDYEDLFKRCLDSKLVSKIVKKDEWGYLPTVNQRNEMMEIRCHYIDI